MRSYTSRGSIRRRIPSRCAYTEEGREGDNQCPFRTRTRLRRESVRGKVRSPSTTDTRICLPTMTQ